MKTLFLFLFATAAIAQNCTSTNPCVQVSLANSNALPSATVLWTCMGGPQGCSQSALDAIVKQQTPTNLCPAVSSQWTCHQFTQTKTPQNYNDPEPWGSLMNYSAQGTAGGSVSVTAPIFVFQVPDAPKTAKAPSFNGNRIVKTGSEGLQP